MSAQAAGFAAIYTGCRGRWEWASMRVSALIRSVQQWIFTPPSTNYLYRKIDPSPYDFIPKNSLIVDIGSREARGRYSFGDPPEGSRVLCVDLEDLPGVDIVADAHDLHMIQDNSVDCVVSISTLEHVRDPFKVVSEIHRILKPGGIIYLNIPFIFAFHAAPDDYYRFSISGIKILCKEFKLIDCGFNRGPASTMCDLLARFFGILFSFNSVKMYNATRVLFAWMFFWMKYLDAIIAHYRMAYVIHGGSYFVGQKP